MYIIKRLDGMMVADQNKRSGSSYTTRLQYAKTYATKAAAERDLCKGNEYIVATDTILN